MECIYCGKQTKVTNSRPQKADLQTWRRRQCLGCHAIVTSTEAYVLSDALRVVKKNGLYEPFYRDKLYLSIYKACDHLEDPVIVAHDLTATVLRHLLKAKPTEVLLPSTVIAKKTATVLKRYNAAASVKYLAFQTNMQLANDVRRTLR